MIKFCLCVYIIILCCGALSALFAFLFDVIKWHKMEKKENIISSADQYYSKGGVLNGRNGSIGDGADHFGRSSGADNTGSGTGDNTGTDTGADGTGTGTGATDTGSFFDI